MAKLFQVILKEHKSVYRPIEIVFTEPINEKSDDPAITIKGWTEYTTRAYDVVATDDDNEETIKQRVLSIAKDIKDESYSKLHNFEIEKIDFVREINYEEYDDCHPL